MKTRQNGLVRTPYGLVPASRVFEVDGHCTVRIQEGHLQKVDLASGKVLHDFGELSAEDLAATDPRAYAAKLNRTARPDKEPTDEPTNYPGYIATAPASNIKSFSTTWTVPQVPQQAESTTTTFLWNGISGGSLQPVLMWGDTAGGAFYAIANWYYLAGNYFHGQYVRVSTGTELQGVIALLSASSDNYVYKESFANYPVADVIVTRNAVANDVIVCWEPYTSDRSQWPSQLKVAMKNIQLEVSVGTPPPTLDWGVSGHSNPTPSGKNTVIVNDSSDNGEIDFYFH